MAVLAAPSDSPMRAVLRRHADDLRRHLVGDTVTYVVNRNLNFTNICNQHCGFCAFRRDSHEAGAYWHSIDALLAKAEEARRLGASELCIQGGLHPEARTEGSALRYYAGMLRELRRAWPDVHLHAFSPQEVLFIARQDGIGVQQVLETLIESGLGSMPGTAAEVLSSRVRRRLCPEKLSARAWCAVILEAHRSGLPTTATLMAGHIEAAADRAAHLLTLVRLQQQAHGHGATGFTEFVLLPFVGRFAPASLRSRVGRDQPDPTDMLTLTAQARLVLGRWIRHHQPSWVKLGLATAAEALSWGCDDLGGTLMEEHITTMAGAQGGTCLSVDQLRQAAHRVGRPAQERSTVYQPVAAA
ncbi:7,8-didemethyl-8-hydroxy-5-deazariboflavin synthase subunit CofH [Synechococcus sp. RSCCF101]|uniref:7,8-didemethyl-8-hydroxy-5-deazariboflavin synthase subunit CofH n=1 Tax=Synechococcus sp. RSCCF101 TaxID=2511069 RepID=UPI001245497B|nr:7,8-didemethyl-8-hydroxy-5-deazariboflavin synthase subunit CofH [Synechococcus sp. RSCCF101]QEY31670.1 7,8-didemethyl-8-hydroxy-5-deazariboflavin synthase subunit CofH [Synechococcus sp. RSCCF101]